MSRIAQMWLIAITQMMKKYILIIAVVIAGLNISSRAETLYLGYTEGANASGAPVGIGMGENMWIDMAIKIPGSTIKTLAGAKITGVNGSCYSAASIETLHIWLRNDLEGENLAEFELVPNQLNKVKKGINKLTFKTPWEIPADFEGDLYIGFGYKYDSGNARGLAAFETPIPGAFYLYRADGQWYDFSHMGAACIEAVVEGDNLPKVNPQLSQVSFPPYFVATREEYTPTMIVHNFGTEELTALDCTALFGDSYSLTNTLDVNIASGKMGKLSVTYNPEFSNTGDCPVTLTVAPGNGVADADNDNNSMSGAFVIAEKEYPRYVLTEEFTTEMCGSCPEATTLINEMLTREEYQNMILVCHHSGYLTDFLTTDWDEEYARLYGGGVFAPGLCADRVFCNVRDIVIFPETEEMIAEMWNNRLKEPAFVELNISAVESAETNEITVTVTGEKCIETIAENPSITVWLIEDNVAAQNQANGGKDYKHHHVCRAVQSDNYWGEPVTFDSNNCYTYTCTFAIEDDWVRDNMHIVALIGENGPGYKEHEVCNARRVTLSEGLGSVGSIEADIEVVATEYYNISGQRVDNPEEGIYICKETLSNGSARVKKCVIRE